MARAEPGKWAAARVEQLLMLNKAVVAITSELELDSLLQRIVDTARELVDCQYAALGVLGEDGYIERFPTSGISETEREKLGTPPRGHGLLGVMLRAGGSLRVPDISKDPRRVGFPPHHPPMISLLGVPIFVRDKLVGDLYLTDKKGWPDFSDEDEWLVQLLATHASIALTNAKLHAENLAALQRIRHERARSQALFRVTEEVNRSVDLERVIVLILEATVELLEAEGAAVLLLEHSRESDTGAETEGKKFVARYGIGLEESLTIDPVRLPVEGSVAGRAVKSGKTQVVDDTTTEPDMVFPRLAGKQLLSLVTVPMAASGITLGALSIYSGKPYAFDSAAVELLEAFGAVASSAIHNATIYEEAQRGREAAEQEQQRLRELEEMKDEFLSTAAHELRTPLTSILMSAGLAQEQMQMLVTAKEGKPGLDPRLLDLVALIVESSERMHSLVNDLLDLTRLEQRKATFAADDLDLRDVVKSSVAAMKPLFEGKKQELLMRLPEVYCAVRGDEQRLEQIVVNLLSNAHKYSPEGSRIEVRVVRSGGECLLSVRDNGPGVPPEEREKIFERFYRSTMHRQDRTASTGLGLPIARKIAQMHRGRLWVEAAPDRGSVFRMVLPIAQVGGH